MKMPYLLALGAPLLAVPASAADLSVKFELPQLNVAEYHPPYVALWLEKPDQTHVANLAVLYDIKKKDDGGAKWLKDMRQWWRKSGRDVKTPIDGVTGATRGPGKHTMALSGAQAALSKLPAGEYQLVAEVVREAGGRDLVRVPFQWPAKAAQSIPVKGKAEVTQVSVELKP
ncbi:MAG TPA: DUF2271 domain-containing protein [Burkholderiaceae bacterium]